MRRIWTAFIPVIMYSSAAFAQSDAGEGAGTSGEVHGNVKRIDDRWTNDRTPAFLVVEN